MDLKKFLPGHTEEPAENLWAVVVEPGFVQAGVWRIQDKTAQIIALGTSTPWETEENLIQAADTALSTAIQEYPEDQIEPTKTVFAVVSSWVTGGQIKPEYLNYIKSICKELTLTPVGFVVLSEAIAHLVKSEEGSPANAIIMGIYKENLEISVFKLGNLVGSSTVARSISLEDDVVEGLARFVGSGSTPSRFILYDGKEIVLEDARQALIAVDWDKYSKLEFLHTPKIEIVNLNKKINAVSLAGASELADVTKVEALGADKEAPLEEEGVAVPTEGDISLTKMGFTPDEVDEGADEVTAIENFDEPLENIVPPELAGVSATSLDQRPTKTSKLRNLKSKLLSFIPKRKPSSPSMGPPSAGKKAFMVSTVFFVLLLFAGFALWWYYPKAVVTLYLSPQNQQDQIGITVDVNAEEVDLEGKTLPGETIKVSVAGDKTRSTTGTKTVGEKAQGEITLYRVGTPLTIKKGTVITGPDDLRFTLEEEVEIASGSAATPATAKGKVAASNFGAQYNLDSNTTFKVDDYSSSDIEAKNESAFSGGSSKEISAISQEDMDDLLGELEDELKARAINEIKKDLDPDKFFIEDSLVVSSSAKNYNGKVGDEATTLRLGLTVDAQAVMIETGQLIEIAKDVLRSKVPDGFILRDDQIDVDFEFDRKSGDKYEFSARVRANLLPSVDPKEIAKKITGMYPVLAEDYFVNEIPGYSRAEIKIKPSLPGKLYTLPRIAKNIEVEIAAER
jgi:hypothetical protein